MLPQVMEVSIDGERTIDCSEMKENFWSLNNGQKFFFISEQSILQKLNSCHRNYSREEIIQERILSRKYNSSSSFPQKDSLYIVGWYKYVEYNVFKQWHIADKGGHNLNNTQRKHILQLLHVQNHTFAGLHYRFHKIIHRLEILK